MQWRCITDSLSRRPPQDFLKNLRGSPDLSKTGDVEAKSLSHAAEEKSMLLCVTHM